MREVLEQASDTKCFHGEALRYINGLDDMEVSAGIADTITIRG